MQACDIELLVQEAIFQRFADGLSLKDQLQFLHDNDPEYIEKNLQKKLKKWTIKDYHTPTYSPWSNGMCEALNGIFKRGSVFESCLDDPEKVLSQIQDWVDDRNNFAPHSALKMKTPKKYFIFKNRCLTSPVFNREEHSGSSFLVEKINMLHPFLSTT